MNSRLLLSMLVLVALGALTGCGGGAEAPDESAQPSSVGGASGRDVTIQSGGISGSGVVAPNVGGISGSGIAPNVGGISGSGKSSITSVHVCGLPSAGITIAGARVNADAAADASSGGWVDVALAAPVRVDLDKLAAGAALPLDLSALPEGTYRQIRLLPAADDAANHAETPAVQTAAQGGLALAATITVAAGQASTTISGADVCDAVAAGATRVAAAE